MLELTRPYGEIVRPYVAPTVATWVAREAWEIKAYCALRRDIFVVEQGLFEGDDRDDYDLNATPIVSVSMMAGMPDEVVGVVRIYETEPGVWYGGRLGVRRHYRRRATIGSALICKAVTTAHAWGCKHFLATVQAQNLHYFMNHHFEPLENVTVHNTPHYLMAANLAYFPPAQDTI